MRDMFHKDKVIHSITLSEDQTCHICSSTLVPNSLFSSCVLALPLCVGLVLEI